MSFSAEIAAKRFGYGLSPRVPAPASVGAMLDMLAGPDVMAQQFAVGSYLDLQLQHVLYRRFRQHARKAAGTPEGDASDAKRRAVRGEVNAEHARTFTQTLLRRINTPDGFRERLTAFWGDHFTAFGKAGMLRHGAPLYLEEAIRPAITGTFKDLLRAAVLHPLMVHYLDQESSVGPNSRWARRRRNGRGLNENLAREVLELHTLGVGGPYDQRDVRGLANLLTGISRTRDFSLRYAPVLAEPGVQTVLGRQYPAEISMARIKSVLDDLAAHPATAAHLARKLAVHFIADDPPQGVVDAMQTAFIASGGELMQVYRAMLDHPAAWDTRAQNMRPPEEFISASLRGLAVPEADMRALEQRQIKNLFWDHMGQMGQQWMRPAGPDGWDEDDGAWVTPQGIAGRMAWAMGVPKQIMRDLPEPAQLMRDVMGDAVPGKVAFAAQAAESRSDAVGLILMSPAFQRR